ncbi:MAG: glycosyltransferase [Candidatus Aminicenantes bacterium]|nr:glycosyltransferase [Candidatus Aminicenantes bacterium]
MGKQAIKDHFESIAHDYDKWKKKNYYYHDSIKEFFKKNVKPEDKVIEFGCGTGDILNAVNAGYKLGLDIAGEMIKRAREKHPGITFRQHDCETPFPEAENFDVAILADIIDHVTDILKLYTAVNRSLKIGGRMCISSVNPIWSPVFDLAERLGRKMPEGEHNFVPNRFLIEFLKLRGFRFVSRGAHFLIPRKIPLLSNLVNRIAPKIPLINRFCIIQTIIAEKVADWREEYETDLSCSVIIPCFNEEANIERSTARVPGMGKWTEVIVVDDGSSDSTAEKVRRLMKRNDRLRLISYSPNHGKGYAVKQGFDNAKGDIIMILDADMTVMPEELPLFFRPVADGTADFANGTRMIYPQEKQAMRFLNQIGNFFFGAILSWLLSRDISDTLCGTKALKRADYANIHMGADKWGDFDLLFGAAENKLKIVEVPVHYKARTGGESKMSPIKHTLALLKVCLTWFFRLKLKFGRRG